MAKKNTSKIALIKRTLKDYHINVRRLHPKSTVYEVTVKWKRPTKKEIQEALQPIWNKLAFFEMHPKYKDRPISFTLDFNP